MLRCELAVGFVADQGRLTSCYVSCMKRWSIKTEIIGCGMPKSEQDAPLKRHVKLKQP